VNRDDLIALKNEMVLDPAYAERNKQYRNNWLAYRGRYDEIVGYVSGTSAPKGTDVQQRRDYSMQVWNLQKPIVDTSTMFLSRLPQIVVPPPKFGIPNAGIKADKQEKILYGLWDKNRMVHKHALMAFYLSCFGTTVEFVRPDEVAGMPVLQVRHPETCYPMPKGEGIREFDFVLFHWREKLSTAKRRFPKDKPLPPLSVRLGTNEVDVVEFMDANEYCLMVGEQFAAYKQHDFGYVPCRVTPCVETGELFGPCEIDQLIATNIYLNSLNTKLADALEENFYPTTFFIGNDPVPITSGPGALNWLPEGTQIHRLESPSIPPEMFHQVQLTEDFMRTHANWPSAMSGQVEGGYATGKAIQRMQAPASSMASIRQMNMAYDLAVCNEYMMRILDDVWPKKDFSMNSMLSAGSASPPGRKSQIEVSFTPEKDINGYYINQVRYSMWGMDLNSSVTSALQLQGAGVFSKLTILNNLPGVDDASGELEQVRQDKRDDMDLEIELRQRLLQAETEAAIAQQQGMAPPAGAEGAPAPEGGAAPGAAPAGAMAQEVMPGGPLAMQGSSPSVMGMGEPLVGEESFPLPYEQVQPYGQALSAMGADTGGPSTPVEPEEPMAEPGMITADEVIAALEQVQKLRGSVFLIGRIAKYGQTSKWIELGITDSLDKATIINAPSMKPYYGKLDISVIKKQAPEGAVLAVGCGNATA